MWRILKAEIAYRKDIFLLIVLSSIIAYIALLSFYKKNWPDKNIGFFFLVYMFFCIAATVIYNPWVKEKRNRLLVPLPVSIRQIGMARITVEMIYWLALIALFFVYGLISKTFIVNRNTLLALYAQTGIIFIGYSLACFFVDMILPYDTRGFSGLRGLNSIIEKIIRTILRVLLPAQVFLLFTIQFIGASRSYFHRNDIYYQLFQTGAGASVLFFPGLILLILSIFIFEQRKSYLEY
jgi:hypothetical protein